VSARTRRRVVAVVCAVQLLLVGGAVYPRLSARALGEDYRLVVAPVDPVDPFRGAYVTLTYPDLPRPGARVEGQVFVPLARSGAVWRGLPAVRARPAGTPYLACRSDGFSLACGIESLFAAQDTARRLEELLAGGQAVATVRVDGRGNAAVVSVGS
jgi:uncharacterized membrane-anchored protein